MNQSWCFGIVNHNFVLYVWQADGQQEAWTEPNKPESKSKKLKQKQEKNSTSGKPSPRENPISQDYNKEFPTVEVESRKLVKKGGGKMRRSLDQVQLRDEEVSFVWREVML